VLLGSASSNLRTGFTTKTQRTQRATKAALVYLGALRAFVVQLQVKVTGQAELRLNGGRGGADKQQQRCERNRADTSR
jgi:hypothetical protein